MPTSPNKPRIGLFGLRNRGKSTLLNLLTGQSHSIVSHIPGTTTDPVSKNLEIIGVGPVTLIDTAGIDDPSPLGSLRLQKTLHVLSQTDLALIIISHNTISQPETDLISRCRDAQTPFLLVYSMADAYPPDPSFLHSLAHSSPIVVSRNSPHTISSLLHHIALALPHSAYQQPPLLPPLVQPGQTVLLVCPIDDAAPASRLILPQVQTLRAILDLQASAVVCQPQQLASTLATLSAPPALVITDSQAFAQVATLLPPSIPLTSFSILLAHHKGPFQLYLSGASAISSLRNDDHILILESCTHTVSCSDIGRVKIPNLLSLHTGLRLHFSTVAGLSHLPDPISHYALVIQCGGCVATPRQLLSRLSPAISAHVPVTNYGIAIAHILGILPRAVSPFLNPHQQ